MYFCALPVIFSRPLSTDTQNELKRLRLRGRRQKRPVYAFWPLASFHSVVLSSCSTPKAGNKTWAQFGRKTPPLWAQMEGCLVRKGSRINVNFAERSDHPFTKRSGDMVY